MSQDLFRVSLRQVQALAKTLGIADVPEATVYQIIARLEGELKPQAQSIVSQELLKLRSGQQGERR